MLKKIFIIFILLFSFSLNVLAKENEATIPMTAKDYEATQAALKDTFKGDSEHRNDGLTAGQYASKVLSKDKGIQSIIGCSGNCTNDEIKKYQKEHGLTVDGTIGVETLTVLKKEIEEAALNAAANGNKDTDNNNSNSNSNNPDDGGVAGADKMACSYDGEGDIVSAMKSCVNGESDAGKKLSLVGVGESGDLKVGTGFKDKIMEWTKKIAGFLGVGAIFAIAFGSLKLTLSRGEEEQIKKGKDIIKWGVLGFLLVVSAGFIVGIIVNIIYGLLG